MNSKNIWIGVVVVALIIGGYFIGQSSKSSNVQSSPTSVDTVMQQNQITPVSQPITKKTQNTDVNLVNLKSKCSQDGDTYFQNFKSEYFKLGGISGETGSYFGPEYHYNTKLGTCLFYISYVHDFSRYASDFSSSFDTYYVMRVVMDIYSNKALLQSFTSSTRSYDVNSKIEQKSEEKLENAYFDGPNLTTADFFSQKNILFNQ